MSRKLLLADDSVTIQKVIGITFVNEDYNLAVADNGDAALEKARSDRPDLILADVFMPGKNGYELCAAVKADPSLAGVPVLLLTGTFEPFDEAKAQACGADGWIAKPFESQTLISRVKELLDKAWAAPAEPKAPTAPDEPVAPVAEAAPESAAAPAAMPEAAPISASEPEVEADIWTELEDSEAAPAAEPAAAAASQEVDFGAIFTDETEASAAPPEAEAAEDIWSDVSLVEEDLAPASDEPAASELSEDVWAEMDAPAAPAIDEGGAAEEVVGLSEEDEVMELAEEDILALDEGDILEGETVVEAPAAEDDFVFVPEEASDLAADEDLPPLAEDIFAFEDEPVSLAAAPESEDVTESALETAIIGEASVAEEDDFVFSTEEPEFEAEGLAETESVQEDDALSLEPDMPAVEFAEETPIATEPFFATAGELPEEPVAEPSAIEAPAPVVAPVAAEAVEERVRELSEAELERIVERVAGTVIERLAGTILEKIAWEIVPDLAESLIKDELRQIKAEAEQSG
ncbi:response regulator [Desulfuromonas acetexigens]|uniref:response regulator n=1 Tax=Trichloromonas acetexigens TaxID=38815 RepID=UPI000B838469|nr:response regulator [Desulfuromonas acetexigens]